MQPKDSAIRKRAQIANTNKAMFLWVAGISAIFGASVVISYFLVQMVVFNERVLHEKDITLSNLNSNLDNIDALKKNILKLDSDTNLASVKANPDDKAVQVVLDALPADANSLAFGASLQNKLLYGIDGLDIVKLQVDPVIGIESLSGDDVFVDANKTPIEGQTGEILFSFSVMGDINAIKSVLINIEKSIRSIDITNLKIESQPNVDQSGATKLTLNIEGKTFYELKKEIKLVNKVVK